MYDKRVVRGSNYSHINMQAGDYDAAKKLSESERRKYLRRQYSNRSKRSVIGTPPPVKGRRHETIQTDQYLEELVVKPSDYSVECQTDLYLFELPEATFVSSKNGVDASTEIDAEIAFDADANVDPIVDALVELTMEQALNELMKEEEMAEIQRLKQQYLALKHSQTERLDTDGLNTNVDGINAAKLLNNYVSSLLPDIMAAMNDEIQKRNIQDVDAKFLPWLANEIASDIGQMIDSRESLEKLVKDIVEHRAELYLQQEN